MKHYYFIVASRDFLFCQEPVEEIIRERMSHYNALRKDIDFCVTTNLGFLAGDDLQNIKRKINKPLVAIISLNPRFINWLKLRIQYGIKGSFISSCNWLDNPMFLLEESTVT